MAAYAGEVSWDFNLLVAGAANTWESTTSNNTPMSERRRLS
jgi:hypothetical protein